MSDRLEVQFDVARAKAGLDQLDQAINRLGTSLSGLNAKTAAFSKLAAGLNSLDSSKVSQVSSAFTSLNSSLSGGATTAVQAFTSAVNNINASKVNSVAGAFNSAGSAARNAASGASQYAGSANTASSAGSQLVNAFRAQAAAAAQTNTAVGAMRTSFGSLGGSLALATGQFGTFGVALQAGLSALTQLKSAGFPPGLAIGAAAATVAILGLVANLGRLFSGITDVNNSFQSFKNITEATRGTGAGASQLQFVQQLAQKTAVDIRTLTTQFGRFDAAAKQSGQSMDETRQIFTNMSGAMRVMGLDTLKSERVFTALTQIISKGQVQMEELRQQLGDSLPGAFAAMAKAANTTTQNLAGMLERGEVGSEVLLRFSEEMFKSVDGLKGLEKATATYLAQLTRLSNQWSIFALQFGEGINFGFMDMLAAGLAQVNTALQSPNLEIFARNLGDIAGLIGGAFLAAVRVMIDTFNALAGVFNTVAAGVQLMIGPIMQIGSSSEFAAKGFGTLVSAAVSLASGLAGMKIALMAVNAAFGASIFGRVAAAIVIATAAASTFIAVLRQIPGVDDFVNNVIAKFKELTGAIPSATAELDRMSEVNQGLGFSYLELRDAAGSVATTVTDQLSAIQAASGGMDGAQTSASQLATELSRLKEQQDGLSVASREMGLQMSKLQRENQSAVRNAQERIKTLKRESDAVKRAGGDTTGYAQSLRRAKEDLNNINRANADYVDSLKRKQHALKQEKLDLDQSTAALKKQQQALKENGMALSEAAYKLKEMSLAVDDNKAGALALAKSYDVVVGGADKLVAGLEKQTTAMKEQAAALMEQGTVFARTVESYNRLEQSGQKLTVAQQTIKERALSSLAAINKLGASYTLAAASNDVFTQASRNGTTIQKEALNVYKRLTDAQKKQAGSIDEFTQKVAQKQVEDIKAVTSTNQLSEATSGAAKSAERAAAKVDSITQATKRISDTAPAAAKGIAAIGDGLQKAGPAAQGAVGSFSTIGTTIRDLSMNSGSTADNFTNMAQQFTNFPALVGPVTESITPLNEQMRMLAGTTTPISEGFTTLATQLPIVGQSLMTMQETLPPFVDAMTQLSSALQQFEKGAEGIDKVTAAVESALPQLTTMAEQFGEIGTVVAKAAKEMTDKFVPGFDSGSARAADALSNAVSTMVSDLDRLIAKLDEAIRKVNELSSAQAASGGSGGEISAGANRYGGMATNPMQTQSVSARSFNHAVKLRDGISNTNHLMSKVSGGGIPSILHPNEAVVPLPKGRSIPVEFSGGVGVGQQVAQLTSAISSLAHNTKRFNATLSETRPVRETAMPLELMASDPMERLSMTSRNVRRGDDDHSNTYRDAPVNVTLNITTPDADSFRRSEPQIRAEAYRAMRDANRRNR